jgi:diguanylate cyclase (GGDEF)-like protein
MKNSKPDAKNRIFILHLSDEMRHPYEAALAPLAAKVEWFSSYQALLEARGKQEPFVVVVDLECVGAPLEIQLEHLRSVFTASDLIALSSTDSAQLALQCIRSGFADFLLKPTSPEELAWSIRKSQQRYEFFSKLDDPKTDMVRAISQLSTCTTPTLVRLCTLEYLTSFLQAEGGAWLRWDKGGKVLASVPRGLTPAKVKAILPSMEEWASRKKPWIAHDKPRNLRQLYLPCSAGANEGIYLWDIPRKLTRSVLAEARALVEHSNLSLLNIEKFEQIKQQTFLDDLTGLYNSRYLKFALNNAILKCKQPHQAFSLLFIDVDYFKTINDRYGHVVGSEFLVAIGKTIKNAVRNIDPVFRYGGDEFVVILQGAHQEGAAEIGERIRKNIERRVFLIKNHRIQTTVSIGIAVFPEHANEREALLRLADEAMYAAKKNTRNAVHLAYGVDSPSKVRRAG